MTATKRFNPATAAHALATALNHHARTEHEVQPQRETGQGDGDTLVDRELGRGAFVRGEVREYRCWCYGHNLIRSEYPSGLVPKTALFDYLVSLGIVKTQRNYDDIIQAGRGLYWVLRTVKGVQVIQLRSWANLAKRMIKLEQVKKPYKVAKEAPCQDAIIMRTFDTNQPGTSRVWLDLSGSIPDARATLYKSWIMGRAENKMQRAQISRRVLQALWHVPRKTLLAMEKRANFHPDTVYDEHHDPNADLVPSYAFLCQSKDGSQFASWRGSNWFTYQPVNKHPHGGQRRKVRKIVESTLEQSEPASLANGGQQRAKRPGRLHLVSITGKNGFTPAHKRLERHLRKHQDMHVRHYALLGFRYGVHIEEYSTGSCYRSIKQWRDQVVEGSTAFRELASKYRREWTERWES